MNVVGMRKYSALQRCTNFQYRIMKNLRLVTDKVILDVYT